MSKAELATLCVDQIINGFHISDNSLRTIKNLIGQEIELGLRDEDRATIKMLITYVRELSRGDETGTYLALDLGGTHFRVLLVNLSEGANEPKVTSVVHDIPHEMLVTPNGQELFDYIALRLLDFVKQYKLKRRRISLGFTFSFPCKQYGLTQSILVKWCKGFSAGGVVGTDVVKQLKDALKRQLAGLVEAYIDVVAVINDTTGTLVACANKHRECRIGLIVGTGFNACYMERLDRCDKWPANYTNPKQVIINCEWGAMGDNKERRELDKFRNEFDARVDAESVNPKSQTYEKMVAGMYVGELLRLALLKLYNCKILFREQRKCSSGASPVPQSAGKTQRAETSVSASLPLAKSAPPSSQNSLISLARSSKSSLGSNASSGSQTFGPTLSLSTTRTNNSATNGHRLNVKDVLNGKHLSMLASDELTGSFEETTKVMKELNIKRYSQADMSIVIKLASAITNRSANLVASGVSALLERMQRPFTVIGYDGSLIKHHPYFLKRLVDKTSQLTPKEFRFEFVQSSDGSGIGAAVVAAALHKERRPLYIVKPGKVYEMHFTKTQQSQLSLDTTIEQRSSLLAPVNQQQQQEPPGK